MSENVSKKRIIITLLPLIFFNVVLLADLIVFKQSAWSAQKGEQKNEYGKDERIYTALKSKQLMAGEDLLFGYEGADANCWLEKKDWLRTLCFANHPYGGQGTMILGGNLLVDNAQAIYLNGYDSAGFNWMMSSTSEPWGNALGTRPSQQMDVNKSILLAVDSGVWTAASNPKAEEQSNLYYGNNLVADGTITTGAVKFTAARISVSFNEHQNYMVGDGEFADVRKLVFWNDKYSEGKDVLSFLDQGVCGVCGNTCSSGMVGKGYQFVAKHNLEIKTTLKGNEQIRLCGFVKECEEACCRITEYLFDNIWNNFVGEDCFAAGHCASEPPPDPYGQGPNGNDPTFCYPQDYPHYERKLPDYSKSYHDENSVRLRN